MMSKVLGNLFCTHDLNKNGMFPYIWKYFQLLISMAYQKDRSFSFTIIMAMIIQLIRERSIEIMFPNFLC